MNSPPYLMKDFPNLMVFRIILPLLFIVCSVQVVKAQDIDTTLVNLETKVADAPSDSLKIDALIRLGRYQLQRDFNQVQGYMNEVFNIYDKRPDLLPHPDFARAHQQMGVVSRKRANLPEALRYYYKTKEIFLELNDTLALASTYHNIAVVFTYQKDWEMALDYFRKAVKIDLIRNNHSGIYSTYNLMGSSFTSMKQYDSAAYYLEKAHESALKTKSELSVYQVNRERTDLYMAQGKFVEAIPILEDGLPYWKKINRIKGIATAYRRLGRAHLNLNQLGPASAYIDSAVQLSERMNMNDVLASSLKVRSDVKAKMGLHKESLEDLKRYNTIWDSLFSMEKIRKVKDMELSHDFQKQRLSDSLRIVSEREILEMERKRTANNLSWALITALVLLLALSTMTYYRNEQKVKEQAYQNLLLNNKVATKTEEVNALLAETIQHIKSKEQIAENLQKLSKEEDGITLKSILADINASKMDDTKLMLIKQNIEKANFEFIKNLKSTHPDLSKTDIEICSFIRMGLDRNEIAQLRNTSVEAVRKSRHRIRKKMELEDHIDLHDYLFKEIPSTLESY